MKFTAAGDAIIQRRIPENAPGSKEISEFVGRGDARFFNLETTLCREGEVCASQFSGGTYIRADREMFYDILRYGFNMTSFNNNHALDFSYGGIEKTLECLNESGIAHAGVGENLDAATAPAFLDTENGRVALISVSTSFEASMKAGVQSRRYPGRPGVNGITVGTYYTLPQAELDCIRGLAAKTKANATAEISRKEGYAEPANPEEAEFGGLKFRLGENCATCRFASENDMARVKKAISDAKFFADQVIVSIHSHQLDGDAKEKVPDFLRDTAHAFIDAGADAVIGHGPHLLRPFEVYKESPIFYSLGDFIIELYSVPSAPADFFSKFELDPADGTFELLKKRSKGFTVGLMADKRMLRTVIPFWEKEDGKLKKLELLPLECRSEGLRSLIGLPEIAKDTSFMDTLAQGSLEFGLKMTRGENGVYVCEW